MTYKAFVSSTYEDLREHRAFVIDALRDTGVHVDPMENWTADGNKPKQLSQDRLEGCDLCVLLVGLRRGHVPEGETLSITQLEIEAAEERGIDVLVFMLDEEAPWSRTFDELDTDPGVRAWRKELREHRTVPLFGTAPDSVPIRPALGRWLQQSTRTRIGDAFGSRPVRGLRSRASGIFVCYRRELAVQHAAGRLHADLTTEFGNDSVFMDVDSVGPGEDWLDAIENALSACDVLLAPIIQVV